VLTRNLTINFVASLWGAALGILMVPLYLRYLGVEAYALVAFATVLQAWLTLLDFGLSPMLSRELARFRAGSVSAQDAISLIRTLELIFLGLGISCAVAMPASADLLASHWFTASKLSSQEIAVAIALMGPMIACRWATAVYRSALLGLDHQIALNVATIAVLTLRYCGVLPVIAYYPHIELFFGYQVIVALVETLIFRLLLRRSLPLQVTLKPRFSLSLLKSRAGFSLSVAFTSLVWVSLTKFDKLILSTILPLDAYGYFSLAVVLAGGISLMVGPISQTFQPRFTFFAANGEMKKLASQYHLAMQLVGVTVVPVGALMAIFPELLLFAWTGEPHHSIASPVLALYAAGNAFLALLVPVAALQIAFGKLRMHVLGNVVFALTLIPLVYWAASQYGGVGAGWVWLGQNAIFCLVWVALVHRYLDIGETREWYFADVLPVLLAALAAPLAIHFLQLQLIPVGRWQALLFSAGAWSMSLLGALLAARRVRRPLMHFISLQWGKRRAALLTLLTKRST
jgi:O-antigen/teichoic acid export membrane protein